MKSRSVNTFTFNQLETLRSNELREKTEFDAVMAAIGNDAKTLSPKIRAQMRYYCLLARERELYHGLCEVRKLRSLRRQLLRHGTAERRKMIALAKARAKHSA